MPDWDHNLYYNPDKSGFSLFDEIDTASSYEFDKLIVLERLSDKQLFWATDSGCSCPTPFEDIGADELTSISNPHEYEEFAKAVTQHCTNYGHNYGHNYKAEGDELLSKVRKHIATNKLKAAA